ncbi:MAG TPA: GAF domain-containing protein [Thermoplasmata archaeon]
MLPEGDLGETKVLAALLGISEMVAGLTDLEEVLGVIVRITPQLVGVDRCAVLLLDEERREFRTAQIFGPDRERNATFQRLVIREEDVLRLAHRILEQKLPALIREGMLPPHIAEGLGMKTVLIVPLVCRDHVLGIMTLDDTKGQRLFTSREINVVMGIAQQAAIAIDNFRLKSEAGRARARMRAATDLLADGVVTLTDGFRIVGLDAAAENLLQWKTGEVAGRPLAEAFAVMDREGVRLPEVGESAELVLRSSRRERPLMYFQRKDGSRVLLEVRTAPVRDELGEIVEVVCALRRVPSDEAGDAEPLASPARRVVNVEPGV